MDIHLQENSFFDFGVKVKQNITQYPLFYVTYSAKTFEIAMSNGLQVKEEIHLQENTLFDI